MYIYIYINIYIYTHINIYIQHIYISNIPIWTFRSRLSPAR